jgi:hypothetical protein
MELKVLFDSKRELPVFVSIRKTDVCGLSAILFI